MSYAFILLGWALFGLIHSVTASFWFKQQVALNFGKLTPYYRLVYNGLALLTLLGVLWLHQRAPDDLLSAWPGSSFLGLLVSSLGLTVAILALRVYNLAEFVGWPITTPQPAQSVFRQNGLLQYVRHPLYTGIILTLIGLVLVHPSWSYLLLLMAATLYIRIGIYFEEQKLMATFGKVYQLYRGRVPMLLPRLWSTHP